MVLTNCYKQGTFNRIADTLLTILVLNLPFSFFLMYILVDHDRLMRNRISAKQLTFRLSSLQYYKRWDINPVEADMTDVFK